MANGWHRIEGHLVLVENNKVLRGIKGGPTTQRTVYPYRRNRYGGWDNDSGLTVAAFTAGIRRGTVQMM